jgi:hypothetical protein
MFVFISSIFIKRCIIDFRQWKQLLKITENTCTIVNITNERNTVVFIVSSLINITVNVLIIK